jgi:hypothetical protein
VRLAEQSVNGSFDTVTSGQRRAAANLITILLPHFAAESSSRAFASTLSAALCRSCGQSVLAAVVC